MRTFRNRKKRSKMYVPKRLFVIHNHCPVGMRDIVINHFLTNNDINKETRIVVHRNLERLIKTKRGIMIPGVHFAFTDSGVEVIKLLSAIKAKEFSIINLNPRENDFFNAFSRPELRQ